MEMRPNWIEYFLAIAKVVSSRGTCARRKVGCVFVDANKNIIATGYNGVAKGEPHCISSPCSGSNSPSGENLDNCGAVHAEQNAIARCSNVFSIDIAYLTVSPCINCVKLLLGTNCKEIVFSEQYPHDASRALWEKAGRIWTHYKGHMT